MISSSLFNFKSPVNAFLVFYTNSPFTTNLNIKVSVGFFGFIFTGLCTAARIYAAFAPAGTALALLSVPDKANHGYHGKDRNDQDYQY